MLKRVARPIHIKGHFESFFPKVSQIILYVSAFAEKALLTQSQAFQSVALDRRVAITPVSRG